ncbi:S41 family peptidase [Brumimicrobium mesophilum]|uniref:S41 family peptidase n=1 Tax=Brumimicrobium mesophilum TaxID=392717 RepID=UPI000D140E27|nr:S41 family peptidase [Brumimicrobium mesophilum]
MKNILLAQFCLLFVINLNAQSPNLLTNPGFEAEETWNLNLAVRQKKVVHSGQFAMKLHSNNFEWSVFNSDDIYIPKAAHTIKFKGWVKNENLVGMEGEEIMSILGFKCMDEFDRHIGRDQMTSDSTRNSRWTMHTIDYLVPLGAIKLTALAGVWKTKGTVYFDDFSIQFLDINGKILSKGEKPIYTNDYSKVYSREELVSDLKQLVDNLKTHPQLYEFVSEESFINLIEIQESKITDSMKTTDFHRLAQPIVAKVGCVHTTLYDNRPDSLPDHLFKLPLDLSFFENDLFVMENYKGNNTISVGSRILKINDVPVETIKETLWNGVSADGNNASRKKRKLMANFDYGYLGAYGVANKYAIQYMAPDDDSVITTVLNVEDQYSSEEKLAAKHKENQLQFSINRDLNTAIITIKSFHFYNNELQYFKNFVDSCFQQINTQKIENLIIDVRDNGGGDPHCASYLINHISEKPINYYSESYSWFRSQPRPDSVKFSSFSNAPYILINGGDASTTGHFCALIDYHRLGVFVGEESGSTYTCNGAQKRFRLKHTELVLVVAQDTYQVDVENMEKEIGIIPQYMVTPTKEEFLLKKDVILDFVLDKIRNETKR